MTRKPNRLIVENHRICYNLPTHPLIGIHGVRMAFTKQKKKTNQSSFPSGIVRAMPAIGWQKNALKMKKSQQS